MEGVKRKAAKSGLFKTVRFLLKCVRRVASFFEWISANKKSALKMEFYGALWKVE